MTTTLDAILEEKLRVREDQGLLRRLKSESSGVDFCSNDYLGLSRNVGLAKAIEDGIADLPATSSTGSRLISGNTAAVESLEQMIAAFHHAPSALLFGSGFAANTGLFSCLLGAGDTLITDRLAHASIIDGAQMSKARHVRFHHNDLESLESRLQAAKGSIVIAVESVYSMDGDQAPLQAIVALAERYHADVVVDEAHSTGVTGPKGAGSVVAAGLEDRVFARVCTFGKALGLHGAAVLGSNNLRSYLVNFARSFIYSTAPPPHAVESVRAVYGLLPGFDGLRQQLEERIQYFRQRVAQSSFDWVDSSTAIQSVIVPGNENVRRLAARLQAANLNVVQILAPTVPAGTERLRITLHAYNTDAQVDQLFAELEAGDET